MSTPARNCSEASCSPSSDGAPHGLAALFHREKVPPLAEHHGFATFALESGFTEGLAINAWVQGGPGDLDEMAAAHLTYRMGQPSAMREQLQWMRTHGMRFLGLDVPGSSADPRPALRNVRQHVANDELLELANRWAQEHQLTAHAAYRAMPVADRDRMTALIADLLTKLQAQHEDGHEVRLVQLLDQWLRGNYAARDLAMAETALTQADGKIVAGVANSHVQRVPMPLPGFTVPTFGSHLANAYGDGYLSVAITAIGGITPTRRADPDAPGGVAILDVPMPPPREDSVEAAFPTGNTVLDLRPARGKMAGPACLRVLDMFQEIDVLSGYDVVICLERVDSDR